MNYYEKFCIDFLWTMTEMIYRRTNIKFDGFAYSTAVYLLVNLGYSREEVEKNNQIFADGLTKKSLGEFADALIRLSEAFKKDDYTQGYIISSLVTVSFLQAGELSDDQRNFMHGFQALFDMKPSDFHTNVSKGVERAMALNKLIDSHMVLRQGI